MAKATQPLFYFGASSQDVEDGNGSDKPSRSSTIPLADDDFQEEDNEITDDDLESDPNPVVEDEEEEKSTKKKSKKKEVVEDEDEEDEASEEDKTDEEDDDEDDDEELSSLNLIANDLIEKGVLIPNDKSEYDNSDLGLAKLVEDTVEAKLREGVPEEYSSLLDAIKQGISASDWVAAVAPDEELRNADLDDEDNQEVLVARASKLAGLSDEAIEKKITRLKKTDGLRDEAEESQTILIKRDEAIKKQANDLIIENRKAAIEKDKLFIAKLYKDADKLTEVEGAFVSKKEAKLLADYATKPVNAKGETQYMIDRNDPEIILKAAFVVRNIKNGTNVFQKVANSKAAKTLKDKLDQKTDRLSSGKGGTPREVSNKSRMSPGMIWDTPRELED